MAFRYSERNVLAISHPCFFNDLASYRCLLFLEPGYCNKLYTRETHVKVRSREISFAHYLLLALFTVVLMRCFKTSGQLKSMLLMNEISSLTHWGRVTHICVGYLIIIGSDNGLSPGRRQTIIWISAGILLIGPLGVNFSEILIEIKIFSFKKCIWKCCLENGSHHARPQCVKMSFEGVSHVAIAPIL